MHTSEETQAPAPGLGHYGRHEREQEDKAQEEKGPLPPSPHPVLIQSLALTSNTLQDQMPALTLHSSSQGTTTT